MLTKEDEAIFAGVSSTKSGRTKVSIEFINDALEELEFKLKMRLQQRGNGTFASKHEVLGILEEEMQELTNAIHMNYRLDGPVFQELLDIAVGALFGMACINAETMDW